MAVTLMTTTGTAADVNAALGIAAGSAPTPDDLGPIAATVESLPDRHASPAPLEEPVPAADAAPPAAAESATPQADDQVPDSEFDEDGEPTTERAARSSRTKLQTIKRLRQRARDAELRAARAEGELQARKELLPPTPPPTLPPGPDPAPIAADTQEPKEADYATFEAWIEARADFRARKAYRDEREKDQQAEAQRRTADAAQQQRQAAEARIAASAKDHPDYNEVVSNPDLVLTDAIAYALQTSDDGPALAYALAKEPDRYKRIAALPPVEAVLELGTLRAELRQAPRATAPAPPTPVLPSAPPPPTPVRGGSVANPVSLEDFAKTIKPGDPSTSEWLRRRNEQVNRATQR